MDAGTDVGLIEADHVNMNEYERLSRVCLKRWLNESDSDTTKYLIELSDREKKRAREKGRDPF